MVPRKEFRLTTPINAQPVIVLVEELGEGALLVAPEFDKMTSLEKADLLQDFIGGLTEMYQSLSDTFLSDLPKPTDKEIH